MFEKPKTLQECFERLKRGCELLITDEYGYTDNYGIFKPPATEEQIRRFESRLNFPLPQAYREFLKFSNGAWILGHEIYGLDKFDSSDQYVPDGYLAISRTEMTSERMAISEENGELYLFWDLKGDPWDFEHYLLGQLKECELEIQSIRKKQEDAKKDSETLKKEAEAVVSKWRRFHEERMKDKK